MTPGRAPRRSRAPRTPPASRRLELAARQLPLAARVADQDDVPVVHEDALHRDGKPVRRLSSGWITARQHAMTRGDARRARGGRAAPRWWARGGMHQQPVSRRRRPARRCSTLNYQEPPKTLDPAVAYSTADHVITGAVYDTLLAVPLPRASLPADPRAARGDPGAEPQDDGRVVYRLRLRDGLLYQDDPCFALGDAGRDHARRCVAADVAFRSCGSPIRR